MLVLFIKQLKHLSDTSNDITASVPRLKAFMGKLQDNINKEITVSVPDLYNMSESQNLLDFILVL